jgi:hypothetical protein
MTIWRPMRGNRGGGGMKPGTVPRSTRFLDKKFYPEHKRDQQHLRHLGREHPVVYEVQY